MFSVKTLKASALIAAIGLGAGAAVFAPDAEAKPGDKCEGKISLSELKSACNTGFKNKKGKVKKGLDGAKALMKSYMGNYKAKTGKKGECKDCHIKSNDYTKYGGNLHKTHKAALDALKNPKLGYGAK